MHLTFTVMLLALMCASCHNKQAATGDTDAQAAQQSPYPDIPRRTDATICITDDNDTLLHCASAILINATTGQVLLEKNANQRLPVASLTKVMTLVTFLHHCPPERLDSTYAPSEQLLSEGVWQQAATRARIYPNEPCKISELLYAMILPSGADAALCLAYYLMGNEENFVAQMNTLAHDMGLANTHFTNVSGLHDDNSYSSAQDMARILQYALRDTLARTVLSTSEYVMTPTRQHKHGIHLRHTVFQRLGRATQQDTVSLLPITGGKTGFTTPAGQCLATFFIDPRQGGDTYVCVIIGCPPRESLQTMHDTCAAYRAAGIIAP